ncbi:MAG: GNAT family N-acetyltransferase [Saprospiraceae bacterium]|nr:GNAT family N-acetyltransferase [Saprospiraceae bacterium]
MNFSFTEHLVLENDRVVLRPIKVEDFDNLREAAASDDNLLRYSPMTIETPEKLSLYIQNAFELRAKQDRYTFTVFDKQANLYAGSTSFYAVSNKDERIAIGATWIGKPFQRTGLNRHMKFVMMRYAFEVLNFERVELHTDARNQQSRQAIKGIGGIEEGILRHFTVMSDGFRRDTVCFSILKSEWAHLKQTIFKDFV